MSQSNEPWGPCPQGELSRMLHVQARMRQQRLVRRATPLLVVLLAVIAVSVIVVAQRNQPTNHLGSPSHNLTCREALPLMTAMHRGQLQRDQIRRVTHHLDNCPGCRERYQEMQAETEGSLPRTNAGQDGRR